MGRLYAILLCVLLFATALFGPATALLGHGLVKRQSVTFTSLGAKRRTTLSRRKDKDPADRQESAEKFDQRSSTERQSPPSLPQPNLQVMQQQQQQPAKLSVNDQLQSDITKFEERALQAARDRNLSATEDAGGGAIGRIKSAFSAVLIADFFVVIAFLVWFLVAAALQGTYPVVLEKFQDVFQPVVVPCLTVLMAGSIASGVIDTDKDKDK